MPLPRKAKTVTIDVTHHSTPIDRWKNFTRGELLQMLSEADKRIVTCLEVEKQSTVEKTVLKRAVTRAAHSLNNLTEEIAHRDDQITGLKKAIVAFQAVVAARDEQIEKAGITSDAEKAALANLSRDNDSLRKQLREAKDEFKQQQDYVAERDQLISRAQAFFSLVQGQAINLSDLLETIHQSGWPNLK